MNNTEKLDLFTELVKEHQSGLRAFIRSIGISRDKVDDYAQEAMLVAYRKFEDYNEEKGSFGIWLKGIIRYLILNDKRKAARRFRLQDKFIVELLVSDPIAMEDQSEFELDALKMCLAKLDGPARELIKMRYERNMNSKELAERLDRKPVSIRQQLMRIRSILKSCMGRVIR